MAKRLTQKVSVPKTASMLKIHRTILWRKRCANWTKKKRRYVSLQDTQKAMNFYLSDASIEMHGVNDTASVLMEQNKLSRSISLR